MAHHLVEGRVPSSFLPLAQFLFNFVPPGVTTVESAISVIPDGILVSQDTSEILDQRNAKVMIFAAMAEKDALRWGSHGSRSPLFGK
jgi:hypothetical protein